MDKTEVLKKLLLLGVFCFVGGGISIALKNDSILRDTELNEIMTIIIFSVGVISFLLAGLLLISENVGSKGNSGLGMVVSVISVIAGIITIITAIKSCGIH